MAPKAKEKEVEVALEEEVVEDPRPEEPQKYTMADLRISPEGVILSKVEMTKEGVVTKVIEP